MTKTLFIVTILCAPFAYAKELPHWAFQPVSDPQIPEVSDASWPRTPVDAFILARMEEAGLQPSPPADERSFARRASFTLTGLPPPPGETASSDRAVDDTFVARLTQSLLDSPRYGERWARHWLDVARYSDTKGYAYASEQSDFVHAWPYRDWVINAFNQDLPYASFIQRQLAADRLLERGECSPADLAAMGFLTLGRRFLGVEQDIIDDRIDVTMRGMLGLTVSCARCHDHKYDPVPAKDYYALYGVFRSATERMVALGDVKDAELIKRRDHLASEFARAATEAENRFLARAAEYLLASLDISKVPRPSFTELSAKADLIPAQIRRWHEFLSRKEQSDHPVFAAWKTLVELDPARLAETAQPALQALRERLPELDLVVWNTLFEPAPATQEEIAQRYGKLLQQARESQEDDAEWSALRAVLHGPESPIAIPRVHVHEVEWLFDNKTNNQLKKLLAKLERRIVELGPQAPHATILEDRPHPVNVRVLLRGDYHQPDAEAPRGFLSALSRPGAASFGDGSGRLELAQAITHPDNPLTARVMVNRIWQHHFGTGLVRTPSDFGLRSEPPSHPKLLDYLARRLIENQGSIKSIHRLILNSSVYRQRAAAQAPVQDPQNRLLSFFPRRRLDFEAMRDALLSASGELDLRMGGKPGALFGASPSPRRAIYGRIDRQFLPSPLRVFDFANPDAHSADRHETSVPQQALFLMNSPFMAGRAKALVRRIDEEQPKAAAADRIRRFYQLVYQRDPSPKQLQNSLAFIAGKDDDATAEAPLASAWRYGYGEIDTEEARVLDFTALPHFTGEAWGGGPKWPDPKLGWARLTATGGHTGNNLKHAAVRRWTAPVNGTVRITGSMRIHEGCGDGVRVMILHQGQLAGSWVVEYRKDTAITVEQIQVKHGEHIDFAVDCRPSGNYSCDDFLWVPEVTMGQQVWNAESDFDGIRTAAETLSAWARFAQALLLANEFVYVD